MLIIIYGPSSILGYHCSLISSSPTPIALLLVIYCWYFSITGWMGWMDGWISITSIKEILFHVLFAIVIQINSPGAVMPHCNKKGPIFSAYLHFLR